MKLLSVFLAVVLGTASCLLADEKAQTVAGTWRLSPETPHGPMGGSLLLKQDGSKLSGTCEVEHMGSLPLTGSVEDAKISLTIEMPGGDTFKLLGSLEGGSLEGGQTSANKMSGTTDPAGGTWTADRKQ